MNIHGKKRYRAQSDFTGGPNRIEQRFAIGLLNGAAATDPVFGLQLQEPPDTGSEGLKCARNPPNQVVDFRGTIQRDDYIVHVLDDFLRIPGKQKAGTEDRHASAEVPGGFAEFEDAGMHERLAARKNDPLNVQVRDAAQLTFQFLTGQGVYIGALPDVAHDAAAVAPAIGIDNQDRQSLYDWNHRETHFPARRNAGPNTAAVEL